MPCALRGGTFENMILLVAALACHLLILFVSTIYRSLDKAQYVPILQEVLQGKRY